MTQLSGRRLSLEQFDQLWPLISQQLDLVPWIWERWWTKDAVRANVTTGIWSCWSFEIEERTHVVVFTQFVQYPTGLLFRAFLALGNNLEQCLPQMIATFQRAARDAGCIEAEIIGRPGWERLMSGLGFRKTSVVLSMPLQHFEVH